MRPVFNTPGIKRGFLGGSALVLSVPLILMLSSCSTPGGATATAPSSAASQSELGDCGLVPDVAVQDPDGAVAALPSDIQAAYNGYPEPVLASAWKSLPKSEGPVKVGLSYLPPANPFGAAVVAQLDKSFAEAKAAGLVEGELVKRILPDPATMTPAEQIRGYQELVREGVDVILTSPLSGDAMLDVVNQAGEQGIVTVSLSATIKSKYAINVADNSYLNVAQPTAEVMKQLGGKGNVVIVRGVPGIPTDQYGYDAAKAVMAKCPGINVVGEVVGNFVPAATKSAMLQFLASHPQQIDAVVQVGTMGSGVFSAFEQTGRPLPKVVDAGASAASLAYWDKAHKESGYDTAGTGGNGTQQAAVLFDVAMKTLAGDGPTVSTMTRVPSLITSAGLSEYAVSGADTSSPLEVLDGEPWMPKEYRNKFFTK
ncbi:substrate-binding domain-containing protein [Arthrobacter sp. CAL618]|uniref:substrate-binding domain-containing protein n=1 Tax=Arthrobacter sp. CAL618 TaxID=1055770 RepID=UPI0004089774|nr:substrate-binding domain-containing protein [Arthrobacter sp. CAL618]